MANPKHQAVAVIADKLWITYDSRGNKTGTMRADPANPGGMIQYLSGGDKIAHEAEIIQDLFEFVQRDAVDNLQQSHVFGYPVPDIETYKLQERDRLPTFTKTVDSKVYFAAGYYGINFTNGGWMDSFCPKVSTLRKYEFVGPFKNLADAQIAIRRKERAQEQ
jgi:hypothetical protein